MSTARTFGLLDVLDEGAEAVAAVAAPYLGVFWLAALPLRLAQAHFVMEAVALGPEAARHGRYLAELALVQAVLLLPWCWGRAVFVRACRLSLEGQRPGRAALAVGGVPFFGLLYATVLIEAATWATAWTLVTLPLMVILSALAAGTHSFIEKPGLGEPLRQMLRHGTRALVLVGLLAVMAWAFLVALVNLHVLFQAGLWMSGAVPGTDPGRWRALVEPRNARYWMALAVGAALAVEPYLLGSITVYVMKQRSRSSGEDLRLWLTRLRRKAAA